MKRMAERDRSQRNQQPVERCTLYIRCPEQLLSEAMAALSGKENNGRITLQGQAGIAETIQAAILTDMEIWAVDESGDYLEALIVDLWGERVGAWNAETTEPLHLTGTEKRYAWMVAWSACATGAATTVIGLIEIIRGVIDAWG